MRIFFALVALPMILSQGTSATCIPSRQALSLEQLAGRIADEDLRYVFIGERHGVGPIKRFAVELANALVERGHEVGLYVEGFRVGCPPRGETCWSLAHAFNATAFATLLEQSKASVHPIDPMERDRRGLQMAAAIARGTEEVRVVLVGRSHVLHAGDDEAELWVYGGGMRFANPGDVAEEFPRDETITLGLETADGISEPYSLETDGCGLDYRVTTADTAEYWGSDPSESVLEARSGL